MNTPPLDRRTVLESGLALGVTALAGCSTSEQETPSRTDSATGEYAVEPVATGFADPWGLAFLDDGSELLVTERPGRLTLLDVTEGTTRPVTGTPDVFSAGQGGLLDVTVGPQTDETWVYLTYSATDGSGASATHLARGRLDRDRVRLRGVEVLHVADPFVRSRGHFGSRVVVGPADRLYVSVGDRQFKNFGPDHVAQDPTNELGTTLRLGLDGSVPDDNPFVGDPDKRDAIFSYGHRNAQAMTVHPGTGAIWQAEHGERDGDEINVLEAGGNFGWPVASYACQYGSDEPVGDSPDERPEMVPPVHYWPCGSGGFPPSGMTFYDGEAFPDWRGDLFVGTLAGTYLGRFAVDGRAVTEEEALLSDRNWRIRAVDVHPDSGAIYVAVDAGDAPIVRIVPA